MQRWIAEDEEGAEVFWNKAGIDSSATALLFYSFQG